MFFQFRPVTFMFIVVVAQKSRCIFFAISFVAIHHIYFVVAVAVLICAVPLNFTTAALSAFLQNRPRGWLSFF